MKIKTYKQMIADALSEVSEIFPWDLEENDNPAKILLDIREPYEFESMHIKDSINVPRGILEQSCEWDYEETEPELVRARDREIIVVCRSGYRSVLAAHAMQLLGYQSVVSLQTGLRGWKDFDQPLVDGKGADVDLDDADEYFTPGSILDMKVEHRSPLTHGLGERANVLFSRSPVFSLAPGSDVTRIGWFDTDEPLRSGWAWGQEHLEDGVAMAEADVGEGKLYLFGPEIVRRAEPHGTFKFLFNGIYYGGAESVRF